HSGHSRLAPTTTRRDQPNPSLILYLGARASRSTSKVPHLCAVARQQRPAPVGVPIAAATIVALLLRKAAWLWLPPHRAHRDASHAALGSSSRLDLGLPLLRAEPQRLADT